MYILIVEDDSLIAMALEAILTDAGHRVLGVAHSSAEALALIDDAGAGAELPDLVLLDIDLSDGRGAGVRLAEQMRRRWGIPALFVTAQAGYAQDNRSLALGWLRKPYDGTMLLASIEAMRRLLEGDGPVTPPPGLELFARPPGRAQGW